MYKVKQEFLALKAFEIIENKKLSSNKDMIKWREYNRTSGVTNVSNGYCSRIKKCTGRESYKIKILLIVDAKKLFIKKEAG